MASNGKDDPRTTREGIKEQFTKESQAMVSTEQGKGTDTSADDF